MRSFHVVTYVCLTVFVGASVALGQPVPQSAPAAVVVRDAQAVTILSNAVTAMGGAVPTDAQVLGNVVIVAGSETSHGTITILTRGTDQTSEQVATDADTWSLIYSKNIASRTEAGVSSPLSLEGAATTQSALLPLPYLAGLLESPDCSLQYVGAESIKGESVQHVRVWNTFASDPQLQFLPSFSVKDIWIDAGSGLPRRISYLHRDAGGAAPKVLTTFDYGPYQKVGATAYPSSIEQSLNGTLWMTVTVQSVNLNVGLTDADFPVAEEGN